MFMHAERHRTNLSEHQVLFKNTLKSLRRTAESTSANFDSIITSLGDLKILAEHGALSLDIVQSLRHVAEHVLRDGGRLASGSSSEPQVETYMALIEKVSTWSNSSEISERTKDDANQCLLAIYELDSWQYSWNKAVQPSIVQCIEMLKSLEDTLAKQAGNLSGAGKSPTT
jgi:hypothetical protein